MFILHTIYFSENCVRRSVQCMGDVYVSMKQQDNIGESET